MTGSDRMKWIEDLLKAVRSGSPCPKGKQHAAIAFDSKWRILGTGYNGPPAGSKHCGKCSLESDDKGKDFTSVGFSKNIQKRMLSGIKNLIFIVGGAYGFSNALYQRANSKLSLSKMTFSHQMVRLIFIEQLYRAMTILKGEPYHHE